MNEPKRLSAVTVAAIALLLGVLVLNMCIPNFVGSRRSKTHVVINNLRQLDGAMQQWALDHGRTGAVAVTMEDLAPYIRLSPIAGERYVVKDVSQLPEAHLTRPLGARPKGTVLRLSTNGFDVILPK